jgi:hypothetical protein
MFQVFQMFHWYIASVSYGCYKSKSRCCICCNGCTRMLQGSVPHVLSIFSDICCKCAYLDVTYVSHICCKCFIWMLCMLYKIFKCFFQVFLQVFHMHVSSISSVFTCMLQVLHSRSVLHLPPAFCCLSLGVSPSSRRRLCI